MAQAKAGDIVKIHFTGKLEDGSVFGSSVDSEPLEFELGSGQVIPGVEKAVEGMNVGESKTVTVSADQGYGQRREELVEQVSRDKFPKDAKPQVGQRFEVPQQQGQPVLVTVVDISDSSVTLDANHLLAGKELTFDLELVDIPKASG